MAKEGKMGGVEDGGMPRCLMIGSNAERDATSLGDNLFCRSATNAASLSLLTNAKCLEHALREHVIWSSK